MVCLVERVEKRICAFFTESQNWNSCSWSWNNCDSKPVAKPSPKMTRGITINHEKFLCHLCAAFNQRARDPSYYDPDTKNHEVLMCTLIECIVLRISFTNTVSSSKTPPVVFAWSFSNHSPSPLTKNHFKGNVAVLFCTHREVDRAQTWKRVSVYEYYDNSIAK